MSLYSVTTQLYWHLTAAKSGSETILTITAFDPDTPITLRLEDQFGSHYTSTIKAEEAAADFLRQAMGTLANPGLVEPLEIQIVKPGRDGGPTAKALVRARNGILGNFSVDLGACDSLKDASDAVSDVVIQRAQAVLAEI